MGIDRGNHARLSFSFCAPRLYAVAEPSTKLRPKSEFQRYSSFGFFEQSNTVGCRRVIAERIFKNAMFQTDVSAKRFYEWHFCPKTTFRQKRVLGHARA